MLKRTTRFKIYAVKIVLAMVLVLCGYAPVSAMTLTFDQVNNSGTISYDGIGGGLVGADIGFETVKGEGTTANDGVILNITNGKLNFTTGSNINEPSGTPSNNLWTFDDDGTFVLTGKVMDTDGITVVADGSLTTSPLLSGSFTGSPMAVGTEDSFFVGAFGIDTKHEELVAYYGITSLDFNFTNTEIMSTVTSLNDTTKAFTASVTNADLVNSIPDPAAVFLLGSACLIGFSGLRRKFIKK